jgi:ssDNA thymidine ADP-ribosyltransferase, DarT
MAELLGSRAMFEAVFNEFWKDAHRELISAHYDAVERDKTCPGAERLNDAAASPSQDLPYRARWVSPLDLSGWPHCDAVMVQRENTGTRIGINDIKERRLRLPIDCRPGLHLGDCVPFYLCPRSVMLFLLHRANHPNLTYRGGQSPIIHLESDLYATVDWAEHNRRQWAFTLSNAGASYFEDRCDLKQLGEINWDAVQTNKWSGPGIPDLIKEGKQAEFLLERSFPWAPRADSGRFYA